MEIKNLKQLGTLFGAKLYIEIDTSSEETAEFQLLNAEKYLKMLWEQQDQEKLKLLINNS